VTETPDYLDDSAFSVRMLVIVCAFPSLGVFGALLSFNI